MTEEHTNIQKSVIEACKKGNTLAQYALYQQYTKAMFNLAFRMVNNREDAEDMLQEAFTDAFRKLDSFRFESTFGAWLKTIVVNKCINHLRKKRMEIITDDIPEKTNWKDEEDRYNVKYDISQVFKAIEILPDGYRIVLTLYLLEGYDHTEISQILNISESTSKTQYLRARSKLKQILTGEELKWTN